MSDLSFSDLAGSAGQTTGNFLKDIGNAAADFACGLYHNHPAWVVNHFDPTGISTGFGNGLMNSLCSPRPGYIPPAIQPSTPSTQYDNCTGRWTWDSNYQGDYYVYHNVANGTGNDRPYTPDGYSQIMGKSGVLYYKETNTAKPPTELHNIVFTPNDPNCNMPNPGPTAPTPPAATELTVNTTVNNVNTKASYVNAHANLGIVVDVGGVQVRFDHNGMTINDNSSVDNSSQVANLTEQVNNVLSQVNTLVLAPTLNFGVTTNPAAQSGNVKHVPDIRIVTITLTSLDMTASSRFGTQDYNVYQAGHINFTRGNYNYPNTAIRYARSVFVAPPGADGYAYNLYGSYTGYATEYTL